MSRVRSTPTPVVSPGGYERWRASELGAITERIERALIWELVGPVRGRRLLDAGCGDGTLMVDAWERGARAVGVDSSPEMLHAARQRFEQRGISAELRRADIAELPFADASFDVVVAITVLCFVADRTGAVRELARVLAPGGTIVLGELTRRSTWAVWRRLRARFGNATWRAAQFTDERELAALVSSAGLTTVRTDAAIYYPPWGYAARLMGPCEPILRRVTRHGAAFVALSARKPS